MRNKERNMKKISVLLIVLLLLLSLSACDKTEDIGQEDIGTFYNLREAYEEGLLTVENVQSIADYYHGTLKYSRSLNLKIKQKIKETRAYILRRETSSDGTIIYPEAKARDVTILKYFGEYNGSFAVMIKDVYYDYYLDYYYSRPDIVGGIEFDYYDRNSILIWVDEEPNFSAEQYRLGLPLEDEERQAILQLYRNWAENEFGENYSFKEQDTFIYYGQHNGFHVLKFTGWYFSFFAEEIDDLCFYRPGVGDIYVVNESMGKTLKEAYEEGYFTRIQLKEIHNIHMNIDYYGVVKD